MQARTTDGNQVKYAGWNFFPAVAGGLWISSD
jgi:hypothetical protein